jgi:hypothetical protein
MVNYEYARLGGLDLLDELLGFVVVDALEDLKDRVERKIQKSFIPLTSSNLSTYLAYASSWETPLTSVHASLNVIGVNDRINIIDKIR